MFQFTELKYKCTGTWTLSVVQTLEQTSSTRVGILFSEENAAGNCQQIGGRHTADRGPILKPRPPKGLGSLTEPADVDSTLSTPCTLHRAAHSRATEVL